MPETLGFIGLGNMGAAIAANLLKAGYGLRVYNRTATKAAPLVEKGATLAPKPAEVAQPGGIVLTMVADDRALEELCLGGGSFVERLGSGGIHISISTIASATAGASHGTSRKIWSLSACFTCSQAGSSRGGEALGMRLRRTGREGTGETNSRGDQPGRF